MSHSKTLKAIALICCGPIRLDNTRGSSMGLRKYLDFALLVVMTSCMPLAQSTFRVPSYANSPSSVNAV